MTDSTSASDAVIEAAPFVCTPELLSERVQYKSPISFEYGGVKPLSDTTQTGATYTCMLKAEDYVAVMKSIKAEVQGLKPARTFRPDVETCIVRWQAMAGDTRIEGKSEYKLKEGVVVKHTDEWELIVAENSPTGRAVPFLDALAWARSRDAGAGGAFDRTISAVRYSAWEALKDSEDFGGQLLREELDLVTDQIMIAFAGLALSFSILIAVTARLALQYALYTTSLF